MRLFVNFNNENMQALKALGTDISCKNPLLSTTTILLKKMDADLRKRFEHEYSIVLVPEPIVPEPTDIVNFLNQECIEVEDANLSEPLIVKTAQPVYPPLSHKYTA